MSLRSLQRAAPRGPLGGSLWHQKLQTQVCMLTIIMRCWEEGGSNIHSDTNPSTPLQNNNHNQV